MRHNPKKTLDEFVSDAKVIHGDRYGYLNANYLGGHTKVSVSCNLHGDFMITPNSLLRGAGCRKCWADRMKVERATPIICFVERAKEVHNNLYEYPAITYVNMHTKIGIECKFHGIFLMTPANHLAGKGCAKCGKYGYRTNRSGSLYILVSANVVKVGITNNATVLRLKKINRSSPYKFSIHSEFSDTNGIVAQVAETAILKWLRSNHTPVQEMFDGSTECFIDVDIDALKVQILTQTPFRDTITV